MESIQPNKPTQKEQKDFIPRDLNKKEILELKVKRLATSLLFGSGVSGVVFTVIIAAFMLSPLAPITIPIGLIILGTVGCLLSSGSVAKVALTASKNLRKQEINILKEASFNDPLNKALREREVWKRENKPQNQKKSEHTNIEELDVSKPLPEDKKCFIVDKLQKRLANAKEISEINQSIVQTKLEIQKEKNEKQKEVLENNKKDLEDQLTKNEDESFTIDLEIKNKYSDYENLKDSAKVRTYIRLDKEAKFEMNDKGDLFSDFVIIPAAISETEWMIKALTENRITTDHKGNIKFSDMLLDEKAPKAMPNDFPEKKI